MTIAERGLRIAERVADWVLRRSLPPGDAGDTIRGDLIEEWHARGETLHATRWYWRETLSVASHYGAKMFFETLLQDVRYTVRSYIKAPGFALIILTTLALGIGASTAIFSLVNGILLRPLPLPEPDRLVYVNETNAKGDFISISWPNYLDWRLRTRSFDAIGISRDEPVTLTGVERAQRFRGARVSGNFFTMLGVSPAIGRTFTDDDDKPTSAPVAILADACWRGQMAGDPSIVGRTITLDGTQYTVVGVMPRGFQFPRSAYPRPHDIFLSMGPYANTAQVRDRGNHIGFSATARLKAGVTATMADRELKTVAAALEREYPNTNTSVSARVVPLADQLVNNVRLTLLVLFGAVVCLLFIACVNVANLLIARGASRQHELAVRAALGGGRARLVGLLLVESTVVCGAGGALGVVIAVWLLRTLVAVAPPGTPRIENASIDGAALLFALVASTLCGAVFGALPALQASSVGAQSVLIRGRANAFSARSHRLRRGLLVVETALALVLLTAAGLMMRTLQELTRVDTGIRVDHVLTARVNLAGPQWTVPKRVAFYDQVIGRVRALPGVTSAALASSLPIDGSQWNSIFIVGDKPVPERSTLPNAAFTPVSAGYFDTIGMRLIRGRYLDATDTADSAKTIVVNETLAGRLWPGEDPVGKRLKQGWPETPERLSPWREVVGVVSDVKMNGITAETPLQVYMPIAQDGSRFLALVVRTAVEPESLTPALESVVRDLDKDLPLSQTRTMDAVLETSIARERMSMTIFSVFALVALVLASVGLYGVISHSVTERTHEIGVRMALGADAGHVLRLVVRQGLTTTAVGVTVGVAAAIALSRFIAGLLFGVEPTDPMTFAAVVTTLFAVAAIACYVPAWRATRVDPTTALRAE